MSTTKLLGLVLFLSACTSACAKKSTPASSELSIASIPQACNFYAQGTHEWADKTLSHAVAYDCGMREAKRCWYFEASVRHETNCE